MELPPFPVDDATLLAVEHALGGKLTFDRPEDADLDDEGPWLIDADYSLSTLLDFLAGAMGEDPNEEVLDPGNPDLPGYAGARMVYDTRMHYSEHSVIRALIDEVRQLRQQLRAAATG